MASKFLDKAQAKHRPLGGVVKDVDLDEALGLSRLGSIIDIGSRHQRETVCLSRTRIHSPKMLPGGVWFTQLRMLLRGRRRSTRRWRGRKTEVPEVGGPEVRAGGRAERLNLAREAVETHPQYGRYGPTAAIGKGSP